MGKERQNLKCREISKQNKQWRSVFQTGWWLKIGSFYLRRKQTALNKHFLSWSQLYAVLLRFSTWSCWVTLEVLGGHHPEEMCKYLKGDFFFLMKVQRLQNKGKKWVLSLKLPKWIQLTTENILSTLFDPLHLPF